MTPQSHSAEPPRWRKVALATVMFLTVATIGFLQPFVSLYLEAAGMTRDKIGLVLGIGTGLAILTQPLLGRLSDYLDARRPLMFATALVAGTAYLSHQVANGVVAFTLLSALGVSGTTYLGVAGGVLVGRMTAGTLQGGAAYARYRVWGSVGYIVVALLSGWLVGQHNGTASLARESLNGVFTWGPLLYFVIALLSLVVPDSKAQSKPSPHTQASTNALTPTLKHFMIVYFLYMFALYGASAYLSLYMKQLGGSPRWITGMFAAGVLCEVLVMTRVGRLSDIYGRRPVLAFAYLIMPLRLLLYIPAQGPLWMLMVQSLHGFNFGIMGTLATVYINDLATDHTRGVAQARLAAVGGLATTFAPPLCGWISQHAGIGWMFAAMSGVGWVAMVLFFRLVDESHPAPLSLADHGSSRFAPLFRLLATPPQRLRPPSQHPD